MVIPIQARLDHDPHARDLIDVIVGGMGYGMNGKEVISG